MSGRVRVEGDLYHGRVPAGAVYIGRGAPGLPRSRYANPHSLRSHTIGEALRLYRQHLADHPEIVQQARREIGDRPMACWCRLDAPCHGDELRAAMDGTQPPVVGDDRVPALLTMAQALGATPAGTEVPR